MVLYRGWTFDFIPVVWLLRRVPRSAGHAALPATGLHATAPLVGLTDAVDGGADQDQASGAALTVSGGVQSAVLSASRDGLIQRIRSPTIPGQLRITSNVAFLLSARMQAKWRARVRET